MQAKLNEAQQEFMRIIHGSLMRRDETHSIRDSTYHTATSIFLDMPNNLIRFYDTWGYPAPIIEGLGQRRHHIWIMYHRCGSWNRQYIIKKHGRG